jgi:hypothetical protein
VFAHSFGTFILAQVLLHNARFKFNRIILCGSIIPDSFDWDRVQDQILFTGDKRDAIINECGIFDVWPVLASSCTWGYGATGTYGFGVYNVRDRFHEFRHSDFFKTDFILSNWVPAVQGLPIDFSKTDAAPEGLEPKLFSYLRLPLRWIIVGYSHSSQLAYRPGLAKVRAGSFTSFWFSADYFRSSPGNGHRQGRSPYLKGAVNHLPRQSFQFFPDRNGGMPVVHEQDLATR